MAGVRHGKAASLLVCCALAAAGLCTSCGCGASEERNDTMQAAYTTDDLTPAEAESNQINEPETAEKTDMEPGTEEDVLSEESGGNSEARHSRTMEITVFNSTYFYENHEISYEELLSVFEELEEGDVVIIYDENAAWNAYQEIVSALEQREILYMSGNAAEG